MLQKEIEIRLGQYQDAELGVDLKTAKIRPKISIDTYLITIEMTLGYPHDCIREDKINALKEWLLPITLEKTVNFKLSHRIDAHLAKQGVPALNQVKNIIAIASGKGGVGKSTVAVNLALSLAKEGAQVGLLDADIYGPSLPTLLGAEKEKPILKEGKLQPIYRYGLQSMSIGYLVDFEAAMAWRGPMIGKALQQMLYDTAWSALDYLIIDLPPGTGDIQLTLCQKVPISAAAMVTTPQDLALLDVRRACEMFYKLNVPILGVIENMSHYQCPKCHHEAAIFGSGGALKLANDYGLPVLQTIPLEIGIRERGDAGYPIVMEDNAHRFAFATLARKMAAKLSLQVKDYSAKFPNVLVM